MKRKENKILIYISAFAVFSIVTLIPSRKSEMEKAPPLFLAYDTLKCEALFVNTIGTRGHRLGYLYELFNYFDRDQLSKTSITPKEKNYVTWENFCNGGADLMIINSLKDTVPERFQECIISSIPITSAEDVCIVRKEDYFFIQIFNNWFTFFKQTPEYQELYNKYHKDYKYAKGLSPYDASIKELSKKIKWDWRLLASLIYQESKFKVGVSSSRGAIGLMQIRESVAKKYGISNIYDPDENLLAGCRHIQRLQNIYSKMGADSLNRQLITIAAYNCGEGRISDIMRLARNLNKPHLQWDTLATVIPLMSEPEYYKMEGIKYGRFKGDETLEYVKNILARYNDEYKKALPQ